MSFHCYHCKKIERKPIVAVIEIRAKIYPARMGVDKETGREVEIDKGGEGWEIVHEGLFCSQACIDIVRTAPAS